MYCVCSVKCCIVVIPAISVIVYKFLKLGGQICAEIVIGGGLRVGGASEMLGIEVKGGRLGGEIR